MNFDIWQRDPKNDTKSVSLTILSISVINLLAMNLMQVLHKVDNIGVSLEFFALASSLYFGRRVNFSSKSTISNIEKDAEDAKPE